MRFNRTKQDFNVIQLPKSLQSEDFGLNECCEPYLVLAGGAENWQNDKSSAFIKLQTNSDTVNFVLKKSDETNAIYQPTNQTCANDTLGKYATVNWNEVLTSDGIGCYTIEIAYNIAGTLGTILWGEYNLQNYSVSRASGTVMFRANFNQYHKIEDIDFTGSNVVDTLRMNGLFGKRDPKTVIDNLIYQDNKIKNVLRENVNIYSFESDAIKSNYSSKLLDLFLLSETDLYITDHNAFNHVGSYKDFNVTIEESPTIEYLEHSKYCKIKCNFVDKVRDKYSKYNG